MYKMKSKPIVIVMLVFAFFSCGPKKGIVTKRGKTTTSKTVVTKEVEQKQVPTVTADKPVVTDKKPQSAAEIYINQYAYIARTNMKEHKIPASITLAQGILESGSGKGRLAVKANNHFGIKCHGWKGAKIYHDDDRSQECFRKYKKAENSYEDHSEFLTGRKRYASLFDLKPDDYKGWAKGLRAAGYATDRKYPQKLISLIERYELYKYDAEVLGKTSTKRKRSSTTIIEGRKKKDVFKKHTVVKGDTLYSLSRLYSTTVDAIKKRNQLKSNDLTIGQELIIPN